VEKDIPIFGVIETCAKEEYSNIKRKNVDKNNLNDPIDISKLPCLGCMDTIDCILVL
jgi:hypothetical protein